MEREHRIRLADGRTLAIVELGDPGGSPVLYFHGYPGSRLEGRVAAGAARRHGLRLLAPDRPGFGHSTFLPGRTIGAWAADVAELADQLELERFAVVGVSGGGPYALACAARIPERIQPHGPDRRPGATAPPADRRVLADPGYRTLVTESTAEALRQGGRGAAWELTLLARPWDFRLHEVTTPVRIWHGLADTIVPPAMAQHLAAVLPSSECRYLPDEAHLVIRHLDAILADLRA